MNLDYVAHALKPAAIELLKARTDAGVAAAG